MTMIGPITGRVLADPKSVRALADIPQRPVLKGRQWYVVHSVNKSDLRVQGCLRNARLESYYPQQRVMKLVPQRELSKKQRASRIPVLRPMLIPLLPRYLFVRFDLEQDRWHELFDHIGLFGVLCDPDAPMPQPYPLSPTVVQGIQAQEVDGAIPGRLTARKLMLEIGERVRISGSGPFAGHNAIVEELPDGPIEDLDDSVKISLVQGLFGRATPIEVLVSDIEKL